MKLPRPLAAALALAASSCSDPSTVTPGGGGGGALTPDTFPTAYFTAICSSLLQCPAGGDGGFGVLFESPAVCVERVRRFAYDDVDDLIGFVRAGSIRFDGVAARA